MDGDVGRGQGPIRRPGAGHQKAKTQYRDMDRFQAQLKERREKLENRRKGLGKLIHKDITKDHKGMEIRREYPDVMTKAMKAHKPGTMEFEERKQKLIKRMDKLAKKKKIKPSVKSRVDAEGFKKESLPFKRDVRKPTTMKKVAEKIPVVKRMARMTPEEELILDVSVSFVIGLESGVFVQNDKPLSMHEKMALKHYLELLSISLPAEWGLHRLIDDLRRKINYISQSDRNLRNVLADHPLPRKHWSKSCTSKTSVGFTCGFWKLMHVATVGVAEQRGGLNLIASGMMAPETRTFSPIEAADTLRNYIEHFFSCTECREHFVSNYDDCEKNRRCDRLTDEDTAASTADWKELAVWLWEVHNEVSVRLAGQYKKQNFWSRSERRMTPTDQIRAIWPNMENCFMCFEDDGTWDEDQVFKFLERTYW